MEISRTRPKRSWTPAHSRAADAKIDDFMTFPRSPQGDEKLVQLFELLACPTCAPRGDCIVESFF
jgi:hypothetical protein